VWHVPRKKHIVADRLLRRPQTESDDVDKQYKVDIKDFVDAELGALSITPVQADLDSKEVKELKRILEDGYSKDSQKIVLFLTTFKKLSEISQREFHAFRKRTLKYAVIGKELYCCGSKNMLSRIVVDSLEKRSAILNDLYKESRHKGQERIY